MSIRGSGRILGGSTHDADGGRKARGQSNKPPVGLSPRIIGIYAFGIPPAVGHVRQKKKRKPTKRLTTKKSSTTVKSLMKSRYVPIDGDLDGLIKGACENDYMFWNCVDDYMYMSLHYHNLCDSYCSGGSINKDS